MLFSNRKFSLETILSTLGSLAVAGVLAVLAVIYSGVFNVAATVSDAVPEASGGPTTPASSKAYAVSANPEPNKKSAA